MGHHDSCVLDQEPCRGSNWKENRPIFRGPVKSGRKIWWKKNNGLALDMVKKMNILKPKAGDAACLTAHDTDHSPWLNQFFTCTISFCYLTISSVVFHHIYGNQTTQLKQSSIHLFKIKIMRLTHGFSSWSIQSNCVIHNKLPHI